VNAGADQTIQLPTNSAQLSGSATDAQNNTLTYAWTSAPANGVTFSAASAAATTVTFAAEGTYTLTLTVSDGTASSTDTVVVTVQAAPGGGVNTAPTVNAGADQTIQLPSTAQLSGSAQDAEGDTLTYAWSSDPAGVTFAAANAAATTATFPAAGTYTLTLTANDGELNGSDTVTITVTEASSTLFWPRPDTDESVADYGWDRVTPADVGMNADLLVQAGDFAANTAGGAGMVVKGGRIVHSWAIGTVGDPANPTPVNIDTKFASQSATKSIGGMALGLAIGDQLVNADLSNRAKDLMPTFGDRPVENDPTHIANITLLQLATHTAGFEKVRDYTSLLAYTPPGTIWSYSDGALNWLADVLTTVFNRDLRDVLTERVWSKLGVNLPSGTDDVEWRPNASHDPLLPGSTVITRELSSGMRINANAMARVGLLYLRNGLWVNEQILSEAFITMSKTPPEAIKTATIRDPLNFPGATTNYGVLWWTNRACQLKTVPSDAYWAWGQWDSLIIVIPSLDLVISRIGPSHGHADGRVFGEQDWNADYAVLEPFLKPIVESTGTTGEICQP
jgi:CubicO group peptidase (beta-lactamase class C family)